MPAPSVPLAAIPQPAILFDADGRIVAANGAADALAGRPLAGLTLDESVRIFRHRRPDGTPLGPGDLPSARTMAGRDGETVEVPIVITAADGRALEIIGTATPIMEEGAVTGVLVTWRDVTEQRRAETALSESERRFRSIFDRSVDALYRRDLTTGRSEYYSPAIEAITGFSVEECLAMDVDEILARIHPDDLAAVRARKLEPPQEASGGTVDYRFLRRDGAYCWVSDRFRIVEGEDGRPRYREGVVRDITGRKRVEAALQASEERYRELVEKAGSIILRYDLEGRITYANEFAEQFFGFAPGELLGQPAVGTIIPEKESTGRDLAAMVRSIPLDPERFAENENENMKKNGERVWLHWSNRPVTNPDGTIREFLAVGMDITGRKRAEETLQRSKATLSAALASMTDAVAVSDAEGRLVEINDAFAAFHRFGSRNECLRTLAEYPDILDVFQPDGTWVPPAMWVMPRALRGEAAITDEYTLRRKDTGEEWIGSYSYGPIRDGDGAITGCVMVARDVTDRRRAEEALRESEAKYRMLFDSIDQGYFVIDVLFDEHDRPVDLFYVEANDAATRMLGQDWTGKRLTELSPDYEPYWFEIFGEVARTGESIRLERYAAPDQRWYDFYLFKIGGPESRRIGNTFLDITERKRAEEALHESEQRLRLATEATRIGAFDWNIQTGVNIWTPELEAMYGLMPREFGRTQPAWERLVHPDDRVAAVATVNRALETGQTEEGEWRVVWRDGSVHWIIGRFQAFRDADGNPLRLIGVNIDITGRMRAETALREAEERYRFALDAARFGTFDVHLDTGEVVRDERLKAIWGLAADENLDGASVLDRIHPDDRERVQRTFAAALAPDGDGTYQADYRIIIPDGSVRWTSARGRVHFQEEDGNRTAVRMVGIEYDITGLKQAEEALREYAENLRRSNEDLERFAYVSSHDLQEPLRSIVSFSQLLERRYKGRLDSDADEYIEFIVEGGMRMQALILDLLAYSRVNTAKQALTQTATGDVLAAVERNLAPQLAGAGAIITYGALPAVMADPLQLEQVFTNLVSNAIKFRREGVPLVIEVSADRVDGMVEFSVSDNGIGIEQEYYDRIFVIFQRLHTRDAYPGTGIGLAIVKRIIDRHGGTIRVESTPGEGSTFSFTLPAA